MKYYLFSVFIAVVLVFISYNSVPHDSFLFVHDEYLHLDFYHTYNDMFAVMFRDFGTSNLSLFSLRFFDLLYFLIAYSLLSSVYWVQVILLLLKFVLLTTVPYFGFKRLSKILSPKQDLLVIYLVSLFYALNTFTVIYLNGNAFQLTPLISFVLAPLAFYLVYKVLFTKSPLYMFAGAVLVLYAMSFYLVFLVVFFLFVGVYALLQLLPSSRPPVLPILKRGLILSALYLPYLLLYALVLYSTIIVPSNTASSSGGDTYNSLKGGFVTPLLMLYSWGIYNIWSPRNILTFYDFYKSFVYIVSPISLYSLILLGSISIKSKKYKYGFYSLMIIFVLFLFFIKGAQPPLGEVYKYLIDHVALFRMFRSPDTKFGFGLILVTCTLLITIHKFVSRNLALIIIAGSILIQGYPIFSGIALLGENTTKSSDRVVQIPESYLELAAYLHDIPPQEGYIYMLPNEDFTNFKLNNSKRYIGQDLLPKIVPHYFIYAGEHLGTLRSIQLSLKNAFTSNDALALNDFPIRFYIVRKDVGIDAKSLKLIKNLSAIYPKVFENSNFIVYKNENSVPLVTGNTFGIINPSKFAITLPANTSEVILRQSYNNMWSLYDSSKIGTKSAFSLLDHFLVWRNSTPANVYNDFFNVWHVDALDAPRQIIVFNKFQTLLYLVLFVNFMYTLSLVMYLFVKYPYHVKKI